MKTAWFTICANNYLAYAITLHQSLSRHHPEVDFFVFLADEKEPSVDYGSLPFAVIPAAELNLPTFWDMIVRYDVMELSTAIKPSCFQMLFQEYEFDNAVYLDPDIYITAPLNELSSQFHQGADLILTPHMLAPAKDNAHPDARHILRSGSYNLGFAAFSNRQESLDFLTWWAHELKTGCHNDLTEGLFVDQKFMELAPSFVSTTHILRHKGFNAAYWNLHERPVHRDGHNWYAGDDPLIFFHFSGIVPGNEKIFSKHQDRFEVHDIGDLKHLLQTYLQALKKNGHEQYGKLAYSWNKFKDDINIAPLMRRIYARHTKPEEGTTTLQNNQLTFDPSLFLQNASEFPMPDILLEAWKNRPDLQKAFNIHNTDERQGFISWFINNAEEAFALPLALLQTLQQNHHSQQNKAGTMFSKSAGKILNAAPSLRPLYQHLPVSLRSIVKTALYRTHTHQNNPSLKLSTASGTFHPDRDPGVHLYGYVRSQSGIGQGARSLSQCLKQLDIPLAITALSNPQDPREAHPFPEIATPQSGMRISLIDANAEQVMAFEELVNPRKLDGTYRIGYWVWELATFPKALLPALAYVDEIWVPSQFVADSLSSVTDKPVVVVPHPMIQENPAALTRHHFGLPEERTVFLTAFDINSFMKRKNPDAVIRAFRDAFDSSSPNAPVLAIKVHGSKGEREPRDILEAHIEGATNIVIIDQTLKRDEYLALHYLADVFVSLHRCEGFGLNLAEAMQIGKPVMATDYSGNRDFLTADNGVPIPYTLVDVPEGAYPHGKGQQWAEPDHEAATSAFQRLAYDRHLRARLGEAATATINSRFSLEAVSRVIKDRLETIDGALKP